MFPISFQLRQNAVSLLAFSSAVALGWVLLGLVLVETPAQMFSEGGPIESASAFFLLVGAAAVVGAMVRHKTLGYWHIAVLILAGGLRELDWDKAFTDRGILSLGLYSGGAPVAQKIAGMFVVVLLIGAGLRLLRCNFGSWVQGLQRKQLWAWLMAGALACFAIAKTLDGLGRKLAWWEVELSAGAIRTAMRCEEVLELFGATLVLQVVGLVLLQRWPSE